MTTRDFSKIFKRPITFLTTCENYCIVKSSHPSWFYCLGFFILKMAKFDGEKTDPWLGLILLVFPTLEVLMMPVFFWNIRFTVEVSLKNWRINVQPLFDCYMDRYKSWVKNNQYLLWHEQVHFNIVELFTRKMRKKCCATNKTFFLFNIQFWLWHRTSYWWGNTTADFLRCYRRTAHQFSTAARGPLILFCISCISNS